METKKCRFFHKWLYDGVEKYIMPKLGPFDPRPDEERFTYRLKYICVKCGHSKHRVRKM